MPPIYKSYFAVKIGISIIFLSSAVLFLYNLSSGFSEVSHTTPTKDITNDTSDSQMYKDDVRQDTVRECIKDCDLFDGEWVPSESGPIYTKDCRFIENDQNCLLNGRSDTGYLHWKWRPHGCELPRFDPAMFIKLMRNKVLGMIGDSISRNHAQSLVCMLSTVEEAVLIYHDPSWKNKKWLFPSFNFTIYNIWSPLLAKSETFEDQNGVSSSEIELHLDVLDSSWIEEFSSFDHVLLATGAWFPKSMIYYENNTILGCNSCFTRNITEFDFFSAHRKVIKNVYDYIVASNHPGTIIYRTMSPSHFENGIWSDCGTCNRTEPNNAGLLQPIDKNLHDTAVEEFNSALVKASENGVNLKLLDVSYMSSMRPDGHVGRTRHFPKLCHNKTPISDCLHWCVPGPVDDWNDLLMELLLTR